MVIKSILFVLIIFAITYRIGLIIAHYRKKYNLNEIFIFGLITLFALFQIVLLPAIIWHMSFIIPYVVMLLLALSLLIISFIMFPIKKEKEIWKDKINELKKQGKKQHILTVIVILLILGQAVISSYLFRENADDSFYVSLSKQSIDTNTLYMEDPSLGLERDYSLLSSFEQISSYELAIAILAKTFSIEPVCLYHSILPFIFIIFAYMTYGYFANTLLKNNKYTKLFLLFLSIVFLFSGFTSKFRTGCLLYKAWQGKAVFLNIGLTTLYGLLIERMKNKDKKLLLPIILTNIACVCMSSSSIFIIAFSYIGFGVINLIKRDWKEIGYLIISFLPILIYTIILLILMQTTKLTTEIEFTRQNMIDLILLYGSKKYLLLYAISFIIILILGKKEERLFFVVIPIINALTIWNPLLINFIAKYLTSSVTVWRVMWLLPIETSIAYALVLSVRRSKKAIIKILVTIIGIIILILCGKFVYIKENGFSFPENWEKIPQFIVEHTNYILENSEENDDKIMVMAPGEPLHSCTMRQLSSKIELLYSRIMYFDDLLTKEEIAQRAELYNIYQLDNPGYSQEEFNKKINDLEIDWIIIPDTKKSLGEYLEGTVMKKQINIKGYDLYKRSEKDEK